MIELRVLGSIDLRAHDGTELVAVLTQPKRLALLLYLSAAHPRGFHRRDRLVALFWPELDASHSRNALSKTIHHLRRSLGEQVIVTRGDEVMVDRELVSSDIIMLEDALAAGDRDRALELYRGPLADGLFVADAPDFERWLDTERDRVRNAVATAAWARADEARKSGNVSSAISMARQAASYAKDDEPSVRRLMSFLESVGDRAGALQAYEEFKSWLATELDATPAPDTEALHRRIRESDTQHLVVTDEATPLLPLTVAAVTSPAIQRKSFMSPIRIVIGASAITAVMLLAVGLLGSRSRQRSALDPRRVTVMSFANRTGDSKYDSVGKTATDWIAKDVAASGLVSVTDPASDSAASAGLVISGAYYREGDRLQFKAQLTLASMGTISRVFVPVSAPLTIPMQAFDSLGSEATSAIAEATDARLAAFSRTAPHPPSLAAYREYVQGADAFGRKDDAATYAHFINAYHLDTTFATALLNAGASTLSSWSPPDSVIAMIEARRSSLSRFNQLWLDSFVAGKKSNLAEVARIAEELSREAPGSYFPLVRASAATAVDRPRAARDALLRVDPTTGWMKNRVDYWHVRCNAQHMLGEYKQELADARLGERQYPGNFAVISCALRALAALGRDETSDSTLDAAAGMAAHDTWVLGSPYAIAASEAAAHGHPVMAEKARKRTVAWYRSLPAEKQSAEPENFGPAWFLFTAGAWPELAECVRHFRVANPTSSQWLVYEAIVAAHDGNRRVAMSADSVLQNLVKPGGDKMFGVMLLPISLFHRAEIAALLGDRDRAVSLLADAFANGLRYNIYVHANPAFASIRTDPRYIRLMAPRD